jgi:hypothetical protein
MLTRVTVPSLAWASWSPISTPYRSVSSSTCSAGLTSQLVSGSSVYGVAGSGICLTQTTTFMSAFSCGLIAWRC